MISSVLKENRLDFTEYIDNGLVERRQHIEARAPHSKYTAKTSESFLPETELIDIRISLPPADYVDGRSSWFSFNLETNRSGDISFSYGNGSALNFVKSIKLISKDGQTIDDLTESNLYMTYKDRWTKSSGYFNVSESPGEIKGYDIPLEDNSFVCPLNELIP